MSASVNSGLPVNQSENGVHHVELLSAKPDKHDGVVVDMKDPMDPDRFHTMLRASLSQWRQQEGFIYHHAEPNYLMLVYWIPETASTIPANASHRVGIGAIVLNDKREILVVQEKSGVFKGTGVWKIPTGVVDQEEDIFKAAEREVREETGVDAQFLEVLAFRQLHKSYFGKSDLFFLCMMRPLSYGIQKQELEIEAAQWMPLEEFAAQPFAQKHDIFKYIIRLCLAKVDTNYSGFHPVPLSSISEDKTSYLYANIKDLALSSSSDCP